MGTTCTPAPTNKKEYIRDIGKILVQENEKVKKAHRKSKWYNGLDFSYCGMSIFSSHIDFDTHH